MRPAAGTITFRGERLTGLKPHRVVEGGIAVVPEGRRLFPRMTVTENLRMGAYHHWDAHDVAARMEKVFARFPRLGERRGQVAAA